MLNLGRIPSPKKFIPRIDGRRFVSIASVVLFHRYSALEGRGAIPVPIPLDRDLPKRAVELLSAISRFILGEVSILQRTRKTTTCILNS